MCKIIIIPNASKIENFDEFSRFVAESLSCMSDGYGHAVVGQEGVFGVRTLSPQGYAFDVKVPDFCESNSETFGKVSPIIGAALFHGRISTNVVDLLNTHPIQRDGWSLIHNGVVTHHGEKYTMTTANDSE